MRILKYTSGEAILDREIPGHTVRINAKEPDEIYPVNDATVREHLKMEWSELLKQEQEFKLLQKKSKR